MKNINVNEFSQLNPEDITLLDVRTRDEFNYVNLGGLNIPLDELSDRLEEVRLDKPIYCLCHHGVRSQYSCQILIQAGFEDVYNIVGGIEEYAVQVKPELNRY